MHEKEISKIDALILKEIHPAVKAIKEIKGKHLRPILYLETCRSLSRRPDYQKAAGLEMIHQASLLHDDIIDAAPLRRLTQTIAVKHGPMTSLLYGDYIYLKAVQILGPNALHICQWMVEGELLQMNKSKDTLLVARLKTGSLFGLAMQMAGKTKKQKETLFALGETIGLAFQLQDDLKDIKEDKKNKILTYPIVSGRDDTSKKIDALKKDALKQMKALGIQRLANVLNRIIV